MEKVEKILKLLKSTQKINLVKLSRDFSFSCLEGCGQCCSLPVIISEDEAERIGLPSRQVRGEALELLRKEGYCTGFNEQTKKCTLYETKPSVCNAYPIYVDPLTNEIYYDLSCPGVGQGEVLGQDEIQEKINLRRMFWQSLNLTQEEKELIHKY